MTVLTFLLKKSISKNSGVPFFDNTRKNFNSNLVLVVVLVLDIDIMENASKRIFYFIKFIVLESIKTGTLLGKYSLSFIFFCVHLITIHFHTQNKSISDLNQE